MLPMYKMNMRITAKYDRENRLFAQQAKPRKRGRIPARSKPCFKNFSTEGEEEPSACSQFSSAGWRHQA